MQAQYILNHQFMLYSIAPQQQDVLLSSKTCTAAQPLSTPHLS
jgi:hypothetical protein